MVAVRPPTIVLEVLHEGINVKIIRPLIAILGVVIAFVGYATTDEQARAVRSASLKSGACTIHQCSLEKTKAYRYTPPLIVHLREEFSQLERDYPNALVFPFSLEKSELFTERESYRFCPQCEKQRQWKSSLLWRNEG